MTPCLWYGRLYKNATDSGVKFTAAQDALMQSFLINLHNELLAKQKEGNSPDKHHGNSTENRKLRYKAILDFLGRQEGPVTLSEIRDSVNSVHLYQDMKELKTRGKIYSAGWGKYTIHSQECLK